MDSKSFYRRYWEGKNISINPFDSHPGEWTEENVNYHLKFFRPFIKGTLLDFGCGDGQFLHRISCLADQASGVDVSEEAIKMARDHYPDLDFRVMGDLIPFPDQHFDTLVAIDVLEHLLDIETGLEEMNRVLKPDGYLLISTSELTRLKAMVIAALYLDKYFYPASPHIRHFTKGNLADLLRRKGFQPIKYMKNRTYFGFLPMGQLVVAKKSALPQCSR